MRCPYCGGLNPDRNTYCTFCGRDMRNVPRPAASQPAQPPQSQRPSAPPQGRPSHPAQSYPAQQPRQPQQPQYPQPPQQSQRPSTTASRVAPTAARNIPQPVAPPPPPPDPPAPFPPHTLAELQALEPGALDYTVVDNEVGDGRKKIVRIVYAKCAAWQQVATLLKALREQQDAQFDTILIQGVPDQHTSIYSFTNGQLCFDRNVRLGDAITNRYQIETDNGYDSDAVRIVLTT